MDMKNYIQNELACLRSKEPLGSDRYNELSEAIQWVEEHADKEQKDSTESNGKYAHTTIRWKEDEQEEDAIIAVDCPFIEEIDEYILFYCESMDEFEHLKEYDNGEDFYVAGCTMFTETL